ncbi:MAG TPA: glycoside hydrolase family 30 beta sandwich domain-containing protein [Bacteroidales bacterium]|nr:glycoside hydrolase family 30 beta sandwich domain-containing protein [Bacteroidales bacterium]
MKRNITSLVIVLLAFTACKQEKVIWIETTNDAPWAENSVSIEKMDKAPATVTIDTGAPLQVVDGFGACFNELGWTSLSVLDEGNREKILKDLYDTEEGLKLNICRMPIGANDYARDYYSLNDSAGDFDMKYFSIERDKATLIPYIKAAMKYNPGMKIWGSPWTPPAWMKTNNHYACHPDVVNDMKPEQEGKEGVTQFTMDKKYLDAYALYFVKYIQAYRNEGINLFGVNVQNEMNSCQNFPSCLWTATDLGTFIGEYLGPEMTKAVPDAEIWFGTYERPLVEKVDTILQNPVTSKYISGVSFQWAGKQAIPGVHQKYPELKLMQSETECGNGSNDWPAAEYTFSLMKHYFENGVSVYTFWNSVLDETGKSMWGWKQNSMISVNSQTKQVTYNPEFYLLKHFSYFIKPGARMLKTEGENEEILAFRNPDGQIIIIAGNKADSDKTIKIGIGDKILQATLKGHSFSSFGV